MVLGKRLSLCLTPGGRVKSRPNTASRPPVSGGEQSHMKVYIRVRPHSYKEEEGNHRPIVRILNNETIIFDPKQDDSEFFFHGVKQSVRDINKKKNKEMEFIFDRVYGPEDSNEEVFNGSTKDIIASLLEGYNCSVFVYGATGAGKTHTMLGNEEHKGIMYLTMVELYNHMEASKEKLSIGLGISYLEVYNENVQDLLNPSKAALHLREDATHGVVVSGMKLEMINNADHLFELLKKGNNNRTQHPTDANAESSRSHAIFQVYVKMQDKVTQQMKCVKLSMIDLAGSERAAANSSNQMRFKEGSNINKSLLALGNCINSLADGCRHVPYRDSKLTRILKDSLGGNCKTVMIANIAPTKLSYEESYNTLKYATRAKKIKAKLTKNIMSVAMHNAEYKKFSEHVQKENETLKQENEKLLAEIASLKEAVNMQDFKNNRLNVDPQRREMKCMYDSKRSLVSDLYLCNSQKLSLKWRIHMKKSLSTYLSAIEKDQTDIDLDDVTCLRQDVKRIEMSLAQFEGQVRSLDGKMKSLRSCLVVVDGNINNWKQNLSSIVYETLRPEIENYVLEIELVKARLQSEHNNNLYSMLSSVFNSHNTLLTEVSTKLMSYYSLLRVYRKTDRPMTEGYMHVVKRMKGIKNVKWLDDVNEENEDIMKMYCSLDPISFENCDNDGQLELSSPEDLASPIGEEEASAPVNTTLTLGVASPVGDTETVSSTISLPSSVETAVENVKPRQNAVVKNKPTRPPLVASAHLNNRNARAVVKTPTRGGLNKPGFNKENIPNIVSKLSEARNKPRSIPGSAMKTPNNHKYVSNSIYSRKTPALAADPTIVNRLKSINEKLYEKKNQL